jgi:hypothetical protein
MTTQAKRARPSAHYRVLRSVDNRAVRVRLTAPAAGEICPLTVSLVSEDELDFVPGATFLEASPLLKQATLPCGHAFGALSLLYHFARRNMLCPCCRRGPSSPIDAKYIPKHLRPAIVARVAKELQQDQAEQISEDLALATQDAAHRPWAALVERVQMSVYPHINLGDLPFVSFEFQLNSDHILPDPVGSFGHTIIFGLSSDDSRTISSHLRDLAVTQISLVVHARSLTDRVVELARTDSFDILCPAGGCRTVDAGASHFLVSPRTGDLVGFAAVKWTAPACLLHSLLQ